MLRRKISRNNYETTRKLRQLLEDLMKLYDSRGSHCRSTQCRHAAGASLSDGRASVEYGLTSIVRYSLWVSILNNPNNKLHHRLCVWLADVMCLYAK